MKAINDNNPALHLIKSYHKGWELSLKNFEKMRIKQKKTQLSRICNSEYDGRFTRQGTTQIAWALGTRTKHW